MLVSITAWSVLAAAIIHLIIVLADGESVGKIITWAITGGGLVLTWLISLPIAWLWINRLEYVIHDDRVRILKGILTKTKQNIPFRAITDFALQRTIFDRLLGIGSINIQTAGQSGDGTGYEGRLVGLVEYEKWHTDLRERVKALHPAGEPLTTAEPQKAAESGEILSKILAELKEIKKNTA